MKKILNFLPWTAASFAALGLLAALAISLGAPKRTPQSTIHEIAKQATPTVVSITSIRRAEPSVTALLFDSEDPHSENPDKMLMGIGSGVIIRPDGTILTNNHVVENAEKITVTLGEKTKALAHVVGTDPKTDLAVIRLNDPRAGLPVLSFGNSDRAEVGDWVIAIGSPFGLNHTVTFGIISAKSRGQMGILDTEDFIQTDAAINPGNSGGPLLDSSGQLIGINTAIYSQSGGYMGIGFAIPSKIAYEVANSLIQNGRVIRGWIGLAAQDLDADLARYFHLKSEQGALVSDVIPNGPGDLASIHTGDVVLNYDHHAVTGAGDFKNLVGKTKAGASVPIEIARNGANHQAPPQIQNIVVKIREAPGPPPPPQTRLAGESGQEDRKRVATLGLQFRDVPAEIVRFLGLPPRQAGALIIGVKPGSPGFDAGLEPGDIIRRANDLDIANAKDFTTLTHQLKLGQAAILYIQRGKDEKVFVSVKEG